MLCTSKLRSEEAVSRWMEQTHIVPFDDIVCLANVPLSQADPISRLKAKACSRPKAARRTLDSNSNTRRKAEVSAYSS